MHTRNPISVNLTPIQGLLSISWFDWLPVESWVVLASRGFCWRTFLPCILLPDVWFTQPLVTRRCTVTVRALGCGRVVILWLPPMILVCELLEDPGWVRSNKALPIPSIKYRCSNDSHRTKNRTQAVWRWIEPQVGEVTYIKNMRQSSPFHMSTKKTHLRCLDFNWH